MDLTNEAVADRAARWCGALAEPIRVRLIGELDARGKASTEGLSQALSASPARIASELSVLAAADIVESEPEGSEALHWLADARVAGLCERMLEHPTKMLRDGVTRDLVHQ